MMETMMEMMVTMKAKMMIEAKSRQISRQYHMVDPRTQPALHVRRAHLFFIGSRMINGVAYGPMLGHCCLEDVKFSRLAQCPCLAFSGSLAR
jgi:hypothetical protein